MSTVLKNVQVKLQMPGMNVKSGPSVSKQLTVVIASSTSTTDAENQAITVNPTALAAHATLPNVLGTTEGVVNNSKFGHV